MKEHDNATLTKHSLVLSLSRKFDITRQKALDMVEQVFADISKAIQEGRHCEFRDFGSFTVSVRKPRIGRNPHKPEETYDIPVRRGVKFRPGKTLRILLAEPPATPVDSGEETQAEPDKE
ncbi:MAG: HU family DNA-binding protein [Kiritimatiellia bacterium]